MRVWIEDSSRRRSCSSRAVGDPAERAASRGGGRHRAAPRGPTARSRVVGRADRRDGEGAGPPPFGPQQQHPGVAAPHRVALGDRGEFRAVRGRMGPQLGGAQRALVVLGRGQTAPAGDQRGAGRRLGPRPAGRGPASRPPGRTSGRDGGTGPPARNGGRRRPARPCSAASRPASRCAVGVSSAPSASRRSAMRPARARRCAPRSPSSYRACSSTNEARACHQGRRWARKRSRAAAARSAATRRFAGGPGGARRGEQQLGHRLAARPPSRVWRRIASSVWASASVGQAGGQQHGAPVEGQIPVEHRQRRVPGVRLVQEAERGRQVAGLEGDVGAVVHRACADSSSCPAAAKRRSATARSRSARAAWPRAA